MSVDYQRKYLKGIQKKIASIFFNSKEIKVLKMRKIVQYKIYQNSHVGKWNVFPESNQWCEGLFLIQND